MATEPGDSVPAWLERPLKKTAWLVLSALLALITYSFWSTRDYGPEFFPERLAAIIADACAVTAYLAMGLVLWIALRAFYEGWIGNKREATPSRTDHQD
jgi:hypothetical protein